MKSTEKETLDREVQKSLEALNLPGLLLYPTDTIWGLGCRASEEACVQRIYDLKQRPSHKAMLCLVADLEMLKRYVGEVPAKLEAILAEGDRPTTVIYPRVDGVAPSLTGEDGSLGLRIPADPYCQQLIRELGEALVSTSANLSGQPNPRGFRELDPVILKGVDYIVNLRRDEIRTTPSRILKTYADGSLEVLRD